jgi:plastocyanin
MQLVNRRILSATALGVLSLLLALGGAVTARSATVAKTLTGSVGPGYQIDLTAGGKKVAKLKAAVAYRFVIRDRSPIHDFHVSGPSFDRTFSSIRAQGTTTVVLKLKKGSYLYYCDLHKFPMTGTFEVV